MNFAVHTKSPVAVLNYNRGATGISVAECILFGCIKMHSDANIHRPVCFLLACNFLIDMEMQKFELSLLD